MLPRYYYSKGGVRDLPMEGLELLTGGLGQVMQFSYIILLNFLQQAGNIHPTAVAEPRGGLGGGGVNTPHFFEKMVI